MYEKQVQVTPFYGISLGPGIKKLKTKKMKKIMLTDRRVIFESLKMTRTKHFIDGRLELQVQVLFALPLLYLYQLSEPIATICIMVHILSLFEAIGNNDTKKVDLILFQKKSKQGRGEDEGGGGRGNGIFRGIEMTERGSPRVLCFWLWKFQWV